MMKIGAMAEKEGASPSKLIDARVKELSGWRGETRTRIDTLIKQADPKVVEEWKWGIPMWSHTGLSGSVCLPAAPIPESLYAIDIYPPMAYMS